MAAARAKVSVSPRQVADALGVSESSVKRWSDQGLMATQKTAGGHRKLLLADVLRFIRAQGFDVGRPELLGLPARLPKAIEDGDPRAQILAALVAGDGDALRRLIVGMFVRGISLVDLFDSTLGPAIRELGELWVHGQVRVFEEHRAIVLVQWALQDLRDLLPRHDADSRSAIVATLSDDPYTVALAMSELTLVEGGWNVTNLGPDSPAFALVDAITAIAPRMLCIGVNCIRDVEAFVTAFATLVDAARTRRTAVVVGGPALTPDVRARIHYAACCGSMRELADFAASL